MRIGDIGMVANRCCKELWNFSPESSPGISCCANRLALWKFAWSRSTPARPDYIVGKHGQMAWALLWKGACFLPETGNLLEGIVDSISGSATRPGKLRPDGRSGTLYKLNGVDGCRCVLSCSNKNGRAQWAGRVGRGPPRFLQKNWCTANISWPILLALRSCQPAALPCKRGDCDS
jgi:hypothetical protein